MNSKLLMTASALTMGLAGVVLSFVPQEVLNYLAIHSVTNVGVLVLQLTGSLYVGFAMVNWTAKANLIGGIYGRPIAMGNVTHFVIGALALVKGYFAFQQPVILVAAIVYVTFAVLFMKVLFTHPVKDKTD